MIVRQPLAAIFMRFVGEHGRRDPQLERIARRPSARPALHARNRGTTPRSPLDARSKALAVLELRLSKPRARAFLVPPRCGFTHLDAILFFGTRGGGADVVLSEEPAIRLHNQVRERGPNLAWLGLFRSEARRAVRQQDFPSSTSYC